MATPIVRSNTSPSSQSNKPEKAKSLPLNTRRLAAWATEITLVVVSGLVPFGLGVYANSRSDLNRVPLHPVLVVTERAIARPLALPVSSGIRNVAAPTNFLWIIALLAPVSLSWWQLYLLGKTGSTIPKRKFGVRVVNEVGKPPGLAAAVAREGIGRWTVPVSIAYILWRYSFAFPNLGLFTFLAVLMVLGEGIALPSRRGRRAFHDWLAGTYTIDGTRPVTSSVPANASQIEQSGEETAPVSMSMLTGETTNTSTLWRRMRQNPSRTLFAVAVASMIAVLGTLVATQVYIQTQQTRRETKQINSQKFLVLVEKLSPNSGASTEERQTIILAMAGLNDPQSIQFLTELLVKETNPILLNTIQQALTGVGLPAIPELKNKNQLLAGELKSVGNNASSQSELRPQPLHINQQTINKILSVNSTPTAGIDLSRAELGQSGTPSSSFFNLVLDNVDLSGINFKGANLNQGSFKGSIFRGTGEDGRWDTYDDAIADLSQAQMKQANFTDANLSRVIMNRSDLSRATLNRANLSYARLIEADLSSTQLVGANLRGAFLEKASLTGADIGDAKFNEANLYAARLSRVIAIGTHLSYANLTNTDWRGADLSGAYLDRANLSNANLSATRLTGAVLRSAKLENTNLQNADLSFVDLRGANVAGADFQGTVFAPVPQNPEDQFVEMPDLGSISAVVEGVDFSQAKNLDKRQIAYICTQGGVHSSCASVGLGRGN
ncbi:MULTISPECIES: pentapeptide repeat-containing protein [unclassified Nodularia (in: cyanobacteria)]|uniref:pentapeptide repeat-containing protein n=1 Tax=unclassified Nodularia (in: cyanobacteria) TaxID=2656917 RepID=UPI00187DE49E|nr:MULTISPECIES: pentapeptide repeat-containing protein [unclassified Nodularia (in: cyanobacteria)]MBE9198302.1 pentapeptide repeat-containing protein [Nodularia sp. LEGE 06071]MCC2693092.1 pentapeptide repeat-containing protein [Nodularia sp. LEGE 04288]